MKKLFFLLCTTVAFMSCNTFSDLDIYPIFSEIQFENIAAEQVDVYCKLESQGSSTIEDLGFVVSTSPKAAETGQAYSARLSQSDFYLSITNLSPNTTYYICAYAKLSNGKFYTGQEFSFTTLIKGDYSTAKIESGNYKVDLNLVSCMRSGNRVTIEATILNKSITPYSGFYTQSLGNSNVAGYSHIEDDLYTDYNAKSLNVYLADRSGAYIYNASLPIGATKKLTITIDDVPHAAQKISVYIAAEFIDIKPNEYCYLTFENVPIY